MCKKEKISLFLLSLGWTSRTLAQDARGRGWAFEVAERSEVGALESLSLRAESSGNRVKQK